MGTMAQQPPLCQLPLHLPVQEHREREKSTAEPTIVLSIFTGVLILNDLPEVSL
jgi:hypothetical protein